MSLFYFVEILNPNGDVQTRYKLSSLPIRIGRSYHNDIIVDDNHIAAEHAVIEMSENGMLSIRDLGSQNGIKIKNKRHSHLHINGDTVAQLGHTQIRVRDSEYQVSAEIADSKHLHWQGWPLLVFSILIICELSLTDAWISDINESKASDYITVVFTWLLSCAVWSGVWALANRVFGGTTNFNRHLFTLSCGLLAAQISDYIFIILGFSFSWETPLLYKGHCAVIIITTTIYYHLRLINPRRRTLMKYLCIGAVLIVSGLKLLHNYQTTNKFADELYMNETLPPAMRVSRNHSLAEFDQSISNLKNKIDAERDKALKEKSDKKAKPQ